MSGSGGVRGFSDSEPHGDPDSVRNPMEPDSKPVSRTCPSNLPVPLQPRCGAKRRGTEPPEHCRNRAGFKTDHVGIGKCHLHGGATPVKHGRYSTIKHESLRDLIDEHAADDNWIDTRADVAAARAVLEDFFNRYSDPAKNQACAECGKPSLDPTDSIRHLDVITKMVERVEKARALNAITRSDLNRVIGQMSGAVERRVRDIDVRQAILKDWLHIRL